MKKHKKNSSLKDFVAGFHLGVRKTIEHLVEEGAISPEYVSYLFEEKYPPETLQK